MPRRKNNSSPRIFADSGAAATARSRTRRVLTGASRETGDPERDGEIWLARIARTLQVRAQLKNGEKDWRRYYRWYAGEQWNDRGEEGGQIASDNARDTATVNKTGSIVNSIAPFLVNGEIKFLLKPQRPSDDVSAQLQQALLNYEWREQNMTRIVRRSVRDLCIIGHSVIKTGYTVEVDASRNSERNGQINYADYIRRDSAWIERINPLNFLFDLQARDHTIHSARWVAEVFFVPLADVLANERYDRSALDMIHSGDATPSMVSGFEVEPRASGAGARRDSLPSALPEDTVIPLIEIWDKKDRNRIIYADGVTRPLISEDWPYTYLDNFPYVVGAYTEVPNSVYPIGIPRWIEDQQMQLNRMRTNEFNWVRANQPKFNIPEDMEPQEVKKWEDGGAGTGVVSPGEGIRPIPNAQLSVDFDRIEARIEQDMQEMTGADDLLQGARLPSRTTASEISTRARITGLKLDDPRANVEDMIEEVAVQVLHHLKANKTTEGVIEIVGAQGAFWREFTPEDIRADVDVEVESFSAPKTDPALERQQRLQIMQLAVQALPVLGETGAETFDFPSLVGWVLDSFGEKDVGRFFRPALAPRAPLQEGEQAASGLPPALAGQFAPAPISSTPGVGAPQEGLSIEDLFQQFRGQVG